MKIYPAIDLYGGKAVRLYKGDYNNMTVYSERPYEVAADFKNKGAKFLHIVDLEGAKSGNTPNIETVKKIRTYTDAFIEIGGGIRNMETIEKYINAGVNRVILGTAAVEDKEFLLEAIDKYKEKIAVGVDMRDGFVSIKGWTENSSFDGISFCKKMEELGVKTIICTDISKDGAMKGTNLELYRKLKESVNIDIIASGGVSSTEDLKALKEIGVYGAIIGKAYYIGAIDLKEAVEISR